MTDSVLQATLISAVAAALPVLFAALGELMTEKVGVMNVGVEGVMLMGAVVGYIVGVQSGSLPLALLAGAGVGAAFTLVFFALPVVGLRTPQILTGFGLWLIGVGLSDQIGQTYAATSVDLGRPQLAIPLLESIPFVGEIFFEASPLAYLGILFAIAYSLMLSLTRHGRNVRAVGEDPASAHASGVSVVGWRTLYITLGGALMGLGGATLSVVIAQTWQSGMTAGRGFVAFALVIFVAWRPLGLIWASYLFGVLLLLGGVGQSQGWAVSSEFLDMAPYLFTIAVLAARSWHETRTGAASSRPASLALPFVPGQK